MFKWSDDEEKKECAFATCGFLQGVQDWKFLLKSTIRIYVQI